MEEILASIRRIISEDGVEESGEADADGRTDDMPDAEPETASASPAETLSDLPSPEPEPAPLGDPDPEDDILELTDIVDEAEPEPPAPPPRGASARRGQPDPMDMEAAPMGGRPAAPEPPAADGRVISSAAASAASDAFAKLVQRPGNGRDLGSMPLGDGRTVEDIVRELLRPMLREWLDANLPALVEQLVQRELDAIARESAKR